MAETHLSKEGISASRRTLRSLAAKDQRNIRFLPGSPLPLRPRSSTTGTWSGVAQITDLPAHPFVLPWPSGEHTAGRVMASRFCWPSLNILGVTVYGWSPGPTWPRAHQHTQDLLQHLTEQLVFGSSGARYISGDFNGCPNTLPAFHLWEQAGWCEVQDLHRLRTGESPRMTCKGVSRPDRIYVSPELALLFQQTMVQSGFADHEALTASFRIPEVNQMVLSWPLPGALP